MDLGSKNVPTVKFSGYAIGLHQLEVFRISRASASVRYFVRRAASHPGTSRMTCCRREVIRGLTGKDKWTKDAAILGSLVLAPVKKRGITARTRGELVPLRKDEQGE